MASEPTSKEIQQIRFEKGKIYSEIKIISSIPGIKVLPRKAPFSIIVRIIFPSGHLGPKEVHFDLYLEGKYPFQSPKLFCESVHSFPSVSDGRDLIEELLQCRWSPSITCADIINKIPNFFNTRILPSQENLFSINFGKFHLGSPYLLDLWYNKESMGSFHCTENDLNNINYVKERMIVVTHTLILIFELNTSVIDVGYLLSWATIQSLGSIKRTMSELDRLTFEWKQIGNNEAFSQQFKVPGASELIDLISKNVKRIMALSREKESKKVFKEEEVTGKVIKNMKIADVLDDIAILEKVLEKNLNLHSINQLMEMYQHVIEYFTAIGNMEFQIYLKKMHGLLSDEKVISVLQGGEEVKINNDTSKNVKLSESASKVLEKEVEGIKKENDDYEKITQKAEVTEEIAEKLEMNNKDSSSNYEHNSPIKTESSSKDDCNVPEPIQKVDHNVPEPIPKVDHNVPEPIPKVDHNVPEQILKFDHNVPEQIPKVDHNVPEPIPKVDHNVPEQNPKVDHNIHDLNSTDAPPTLENKNEPSNLIHPSENTEKSLEIHEAQEKRDEVDKIVEKLNIKEVNSEDEVN